MASVELKSIGKSFGSTPVLGGIDLAVADGEFMTLVGPSGCGKTTLIRIIAGIESQDAGAVLIGGSSIDHLRPHERRVAMVFQSYALYPHMSVRGNLSLPLVMSRLRLHERVPLIRLLSSRRRETMHSIEGEVEAVAQQLQLGALLDRRPAQLSGGQRQRVALGRAMVRHPDVFLMDEPLSNLDAKLRVHMRTELAELHQRLGATFIYVTHDQVEAMTMSDRVAMMDAGHILQLGTPTELYGRPANVKVAQFIGSPTINLLPGSVGSNDAVELLGRRLQLAVDLPAGSPLTIGLRPEALTAVPANTAPADAGSLPARLRRRENLGAEHILHFDLPGAALPPVVARAPPELQLPADGHVALTFDPLACHLFDPSGARVEARRAEGSRDPVVVPFRS
ncbi:MAG: transporter ATP-binding protein [Microvirga sp.]|nr:transporter ATP-binding protein [Microvirga sp.]MDF2973925.1 transporter ATP-binding protein [Microvirga sp.]